MKNLSQMHIEFIKASPRPAKMLLINRKDIGDFLDQIRMFGIKIIPDIPVHVSPDHMSCYIG